jgi:lipopolysaccharide/colanic/teichoic acid biosynthesis glycosyltransferase
MMKRLIDVVIALVGLLLTSPILLLIYLWIRLSMGDPVSFRQQRPGLHGVPFEMIKFRTMRDDRDSSGSLLPDADRLPATGRFLRATSLDELPELWNVLRGDMSLVGPRPLLMRYLPLYNDQQFRRHTVKPGLTGWAQVNGRNSLSWEEKFELDVWYVDNHNIWLDIKIIAMTVLKVLRADGISAKDEATMSEFRGSGT